MFKVKKIIINISSILFILLSIIETIIYLFSRNTIFGLYYLLINLLIIFLFVPCAYNYRRNYSSARISKLIIIILLGFFNSFFLQKIVISSINYMDYSLIYIDKIFIFKNILKLLIYIILIVFTFYESKLDKKIMKSIKNKNID